MMKLKNVPTTSSLRNWVSTKSWIFLILLITFLVIWVQGRPLFDNGLYKDGSLIFKDTVILRDSLVHLSLINEIGERFPPTNFASGGVALKNYHYLYDAGLALFLKVIPISPLGLYFRLMPIVLSTVLCFVIFQTVKELTKNKFFAALGVFFTVFATSLGALIPHIKIFLNARTVTGGNNMFMTDQIYTMMINPQGVLSLIIFLTLFLLLVAYDKSKKLLPLAFFAVVLGLSFGIKAYGGIVFAVGAGGFSLYYILIKRDLRPLFATMLGGVLMVFLYFQTIDNKVAGINFAPFWLLDAMYNDLDRLNEPALPFLKSTYLYLGSWHHVIRLTVEQFVAYFIGSLGLRLIGLAGIIYLLINAKKITPAIAFLFISAAVSFVIPLFFNQSSKAYDIVQFTPYFTILMGICFTVALFVLCKKLKNFWLSTIIIIFFVSIFLALVSRDFADLERERESIVFSKSEVEAIGFIKSKTPPKSIFLLHVAPDKGVGNFNDEYLWLPGLAGRRTYYSGERFAFQIGVDVKKKKEEILNVSKSEPCPLKFDYIYAKKSDIDKFDRIKTVCKTEVVFDNNEVTIFYHNH